MPELRETLGRLAMLEPDRFRFVRGDSAQIRFGTQAHNVWGYGPETQAILAAALMELVDSKGWGLTMDKSYLGWQVGIYEELGGEDDAPMPLGEAESKTESFALVLARAVVTALEGERG